MSAYLLLKVACCVISIVLAAAIVGRDPRLKVNWLLGAIPSIAAWWGFCEIVWNTRSDPIVAAHWVRLSGLGWLMLGPICLHLFVEFQGIRRHWIRRLVPWTYASAAIALGLYNLTPYCVHHVEPVSWGWTPAYGPLFMLAYGATIWPAAFVLYNWKRLYPRKGSRGERRVAIAVALAVALVMVFASLNEVTLPLLGFAPERHGSFSLTLSCLLVAWHLWRYGYSLVSTGSFAQEILGSLRDGVALVLSDGTIRAANPALERLVGIGSSGLHSIPVSDILPELADELAARGASSDRVVHTILRRKNGELRPVRVTTCSISQRVGAGELYLGDALVVSDTREIAALRDRLLNSSRLAAVGELSAGISHEISNPVTRVRDNLARLRRSWGRLAECAEEIDELKAFEELYGEGDELIDECMEGATRVTAILRDVRGFSAAADAGRVHLDLNAAVEAAVRVVERQREPGVSVETELGILPPLEGMAQEIEQVVVNLLVNALQAVGDQGSVRVRTECCEDEAVLSVSDDGCGVPEDVAERIFDPFFTTKPVGMGTGLGLAICLRLVRGHGGELQFDSKVGEGSTFRVRLPLARD